MTDDDRAALAASTIELLSRKWHPIIVHRLLEAGPLGFTEIQSRVEGISAKVLTDSLDDLVDRDLVDRTVISERPRRVEYDLTERGRDLRTVIATLAGWGERHLAAPPDPLVLLVDDDPRLASMYAGWLADRFRVEVAQSGEEAIRCLTDAVDVVLLDRRLPGIPGDEVLARIREIDGDVPVVLLTAVGPDFDVVDLPADAYVRKPVEEAALLDVVEEAVRRGEAGGAGRELSALRARRAAIRERKTGVELADCDAFARLEARIDRLAASAGREAGASEPAAEGVLTDGS